MELSGLALDVSKVIINLITNVLYVMLIIVSIALMRKNVNNVKMDTF